LSNIVPLISIGLPVYNGEKYIESSIDSILAQTFGDFELIISDNASTDNTEIICKKYAENDSRIIYHRNEENVGAARNYNLIVEKARGKYFRWQNADDLIEPDLHQLCLDTLEKNPDAVLAYGKTKIIDGNNKVLSEYEDNLDLQEDSVYERLRTFFDNVGMTNIIYGLIRTKELSQTAMMQGFIASDTNLLGELCLYGKFIEIPVFLFSRRMHEEASSWDKKDEDVQKDFWDPKKKKLKYQIVLRHIAYLKASLRAPIKEEKLKTVVFILRRMIWSRQKLIKDIKQSLFSK